MKDGANNIEINKIKKLAVDGLSVEEISDALRIEPKCVKSFMPKAAEIKAAQKASEDGE